MSVVYQLIERFADRFTNITYYTYDTLAVV